MNAQVRFLAGFAVLLAYVFLPVALAARLGYLATDSAPPPWLRFSDDSGNLAFGSLATGLSILLWLLLGIVAGAARAR